MIDPLISLIVSMSLALLFFMAARHKLSAPRQFEAQLEAYELLPKSILPLAARTLPLLEIAVAVLVLIPFTRPYAAMVAASLLTAYALAMGINMMRGRADIDCGCGGEPQVLSAWLLLRNAVLVSGSCLLLLPQSSRALAWADGFFLILLTAVLALVYLLVEQLVRNQSALLNRSSSNG